MYALTIVAALATLVPAAMAAGTATVNNNCDFDVYVWSVLEDSSSSMTTIAAGDSYSEEYQTTSSGGVSLKLATDADSETVTQFEYTVSGSSVFYDVSNIDGYPFMSNGLTLTPSDSSCSTVTCDAGVEICTEAYNQPDDNWATLACDVDADLVLELCISSSTTSEATSSADSAVKRTMVIPPQARHLHQAHHIARNA